MIRPEEMTKVSIVGPRSRMRTVIERLHDLGVLHIDEYDEALEGADIGDPIPEAEELSDQLVKIRSIKSRLPDADPDGEPEETIDAIGERVEEIEEELARIRERREDLEQLREKLEHVQDMGLDLGAFQDYRTLDIYFGAADRPGALEDLEEGRFELYRSGDVVALFVDSDLSVDDALRGAGFESMGVDDLKGRTPPVDQQIAEVEDEIAGLEEDEADLQEELGSLAARWRSELEEREDELEEELAKAEAPLSFATTDKAFIAEGWIPTERYDEVTEELEKASQGSIHIMEADDGDDAPIKHDNPGPVRPMQDLLGVYGVPSYTEVDPSFLLLTFPILFGFMLGDVGYGITTFAVFYGLYRKFPDAKGLWYSLMYASAATIAFGLAYGEMFGYIIFGHHSVLAKLTGIHLFEQIPILFHRVEHLGTVLKWSVLIGAVHVNAGFLIGAYNEYIQHGFKEAVLAKLSWLVLEAGAGIAALSALGIVPGLELVGAGIAVLGVAMLAMGEGIEGIVEIPSLLSNILSYLRVFGVVMAVVALAAVVNSMAEPLFQSGSILMAALGVGVLVIGHTFNTFLKLMESGLQGIRLHYVEFFTKFFEGGGTYYRPFGGERRTGAA